MRPSRRVTTGKRLTRLLGGWSLMGAMLTAASGCATGSVLEETGSGGAGQGGQSSSSSGSQGGQTGQGGNTPSTCGDGAVTGSEACDDSNTTAGDGCASDCSVEMGWSCSGSPSVCSPGCGDGIVAGPEGCDDGNMTAGDGCASDCSVEMGWSCSGSPSSCVDVDECAQNLDNCDTNATCTNTTGSFDCTCNAGYSGTGQMCSDVDECAQNVCDPNATCMNTPGSYTCTCNAGYMGNGATCTDIDECAQNLDNCNTNANCTNTPGSFSCACKSGYMGDGVTCTNIDDCTPNPCQNGGTCTDGVNSYTCACPNGYSGQNCEIAINLPSYTPSCGAGQTMLVFSNTTPQAIPDDDLIGITSSISVPSTATIASVSVLFNITHTYDDDLDISLIPQGGSSIAISTANGGGGDNYTNTVLSPACSTSVTSGSAPFSGCYIPESVTQVNSLNGTSANGTWKLKVVDTYFLDTGTLQNWHLILCVTP